MSRSYRNDGFEMDEYSSRERPREESLPGQVYDRYYPDQASRQRRYDDNSNNGREDPYTFDQRGSNLRRDPRYDERVLDDRDELKRRFQKYDSNSERTDRPRQENRPHNGHSRAYDGRPFQRDPRMRGDREWTPRQDYDHHVIERHPNDYRGVDEAHNIYTISRHIDGEPDQRSEYASRPYSSRDPNTAEIQGNEDRNSHQRSSHRESEHGQRQSQRSSKWGNVRTQLPSQMDSDRGTLRFRGAVGQVHPRAIPDRADSQNEDNQPKTKAEVFEQLTKLREQPWAFRLRKQRKEELKQRLGQFGTKRYNIGPVVSAVGSGSSKVQDVVNTLDPLHGMLKRIEGKHGASVVAVFNFIRDMIRLNFLLALLLLGGVVVPSSISVSEDTDQNYAWYSGGNCSSQPKNVCGALKLLNDSWMTECHQNYVDKVDSTVSNHSTKVFALIQDFLQGTGFLEYTLLFSGYYPAAVLNGSYLVSLAYLLTVFVTYMISLFFVVHSVAKFLKNITSFTTDYGMIFSKIVFTGWDFTVKESDAAKIESSLFICEVRAAFDEEEHNRRSLERTRNDRIFLYLGRIVINIIIMTLIGGSWAGIYFLIKESQKHTDDTPFLQFIWQYAPTLVVAGLNLIFPMIFTFLVVHEQYKGSIELFLTLSRCVLVRLISLAILVISKVGLISQQSQVCEANSEFVCWETYLGQQVYSVLILDALIQVGMNLVVNVLRSWLRRIDNPICKMIGTIEFFVPGHVLDIVYVQAVCWIGVLYSPLIVAACFLYLCILFFLKLFTVSVTCVPATRVFRSSRSSAMFMTILALAFFMCLVPNGLALFYLCPSIACSPFRGLGFAWQSVTYYICSLSDGAYWIRSTLFILDDTIVIVAVVLIVFIVAVYYIAIFSARGLLIEDLEKKLKNANKDKNYLLQEYNSVQALSAS